MESQSQKNAWTWLRESVANLWDWVVDAAVILWIVRISLFSTLIGCLFFVLVPQVRDTFLEVRGDQAASNDNFRYWVLFFVLAILLWALPVHYAARRNVRRDPIFHGRAEPSPERHARLELLGIWIPRALGAVCLFTIAIGASLASAGLRVPGDAGTAFSNVIDLYTQVQNQTKTIAVVALVLCGGVFVFLIYRTNIFSPASNARLTRMLTSETTGTLLLTGLLLVFLLLFFLPVSWFTVARAPLIPLLLGGWVPFLALLAFYGRESRAPLILLLIVILQLLTLLGNNHDVRTFWLKSDGLPSRIDPGLGKDGEFAPLTFEKAITAWRSINCSPEGKCPRPIVIAASGGASRAGFFTASILGELMDRTRDQDAFTDFRNQLFAISSVSGGSTGAAFFAAALRDAGPDGQSPCHKVDTKQLVFFDHAPKSWRQCMQQLLSGDFISSTLLGYVYKDTIGGIAALAYRLGFTIPDRATVLETAWEQQYCELAGASDCATADFKGLQAGFLQIAAASERDVADKRWYPLLFFNGTDVDTGRRVLVSPLASHLEKGGRPFADTYDLHDLLADRPKTDNGHEAGKEGAQLSGWSRDVSLSTAALLSARFPFISPPGNIRNRNGQLVTRIVDGGYFENFGAATALEIVQVLRGQGLAPFVIQITNDPELLFAEHVENPAPDAVNPTLCNVKDVDPICQNDPPIINAEDVYWFSDVRGPLSGLFGSRSAQGGRALRQLANFSGPSTSFCPSKRATDRNALGFIHLVVHPQYQLVDESNHCKLIDVSMSWWLSKPVQEYLDFQIGQNEPAIGEALEVLKKDAVASAVSTCAAAAVSQ